MELVLFDPAEVTDPISVPLTAWDDDIEALDLLALLVFDLTALPGDDIALLPGDDIALLPVEDAALLPGALEPTFDPAPERLDPIPEAVLPPLPSAL